MSQPIPLELVSTPDLFAELATRYEHGIFYGLKTISADNAPEQEVVESKRNWGSQLVCEGMCAQLAAEIAGDHFRGLQPMLSEEL